MTKYQIANLDFVRAGSDEGIRGHQETKRKFSMFKKMFLGLALASLVASPASTKNPLYNMGEISLAQPAPDGYTFGEREWYKPEVVINTVFVESRRDVERLFAEKVGPNAPRERQKLMAFSTISVKSNVCTIYAVAPERDYKPEYVGHEVMHCIFGRFHR